MACHTDHFPACDWTWGPGTWLFLVDCPLQNSVTRGLHCYPSQGVVPFSLMSLLLCGLRAFLQSCLLPLYFSEALSQNSSFSLYGPSTCFFQDPSIFQLGKLIWQVSSGSSECSYYDPYLIQSSHSMRKLNEVHNTRYVLRWEKNPLNHEFQYLANLIHLKIAKAHSCYNHFLVVASRYRHLNLKIAQRHRNTTITSKRLCLHYVTGNMYAFWGGSTSTGDD